MQTYFPSAIFRAPETCLLYFIEFSFAVRAKYWPCTRTNSMPGPLRTWKAHQNLVLNWSIPIVVKPQSTPCTCHWYHQFNPKKIVRDWEMTFLVTLWSYYMSCFVWRLRACWRMPTSWQIHETRNTWTKCMATSETVGKRCKSSCRLNAKIMNHI